MASDSESKADLFAARLLKILSSIKFSAPDTHTHTCMFWSEAKRPYILTNFDLKKKTTKQNKKQLWSVAAAIWQTGAQLMPLIHAVKKKKKRDAPDGYICKWDVQGWVKRMEVSKGLLKSLCCPVDWCRYPVLGLSPSADQSNCQVPGLYLQHKTCTTAAFFIIVVLLPPVQLRSQKSPLMTLKCVIPCEHLQRHFTCLFVL